MSFVVSQQLIDARDKDSWKALCHDILQYAQLKVKWGLGPIVLKHKNCRNTILCYCNGRIPCTNKHLTIFGKYEGLIHDVQQRFLDHSFKEAVARVNDAKLFLFTA